MNTLYYNYKIIADGSSQYIIAGDDVVKATLNGVKLASGIYNIQSKVMYDEPSLIWSDGYRKLYKAEATIDIYIDCFSFRPITTNVFFDDGIFDFCNICGNWGNHIELWLPVRNVRSFGCDWVCSLKGKLEINQ